MRWHLSVAALLSMVALPIFAQAPAAIPDFSGLWAHPNVGWEYPVSGPGPVRHKGGATGSALLVGDDSNPVLKPDTAAIIRRNSQISLSGLAFPDPDNQCTGPLSSTSVTPVDSENTRMCSCSAAMRLGTTCSGRTIFARTGALTT